MISEHIVINETIKKKLDTFTFPLLSSLGLVLENILKYFLSRLVAAAPAPAPAPAAAWLTFS